MTIEKLFRIIIFINIIADKAVGSKVTTIIPTSIKVSINSYSINSIINRSILVILRSLRLLIHIIRLLVKLRFILTMKSSILLFILLEPLIIK